MRSKLAQQQRRELAAAILRLTPEHRLEAFLVHSRLMADLQRCGRELRLRRQPR